MPAGSDGLLFLPYLTGERTPHPDPLARGAFVGLTVRHDLRHMTRAVLEGVAFGLRDGLDLMTGAGMAQPDRDPRLGRWHPQRTVASDPRRRPRGRDRHRRHRGGGRLRGRPARRRRCRMVRDRRSGRGQGHRGGARGHPFIGPRDLRRGSHPLYRPLPGAFADIPDPHLTLSRSPVSDTRPRPDRSAPGPKSRSPACRK